VTWAARTLENSTTRCDGVVKSFAGLSISLTISGSSLHATADKRTASTRNLARFPLNRNLIWRDSGTEAASCL
jgi:hypothetical protein